MRNDSSAVDHGDNSPGVIFDLDGTLADTLHDLTGSLNHALASIGFATVEPADVRRMVGDGLPMLIERATGTSDPVTVDEIVARFTKHHHQHFLDRTVLYPGISEVLDELHQRGCPMSVLSNKPHPFTLAIHQALLSRWRFVAVVGASEQTPRKPDPSGALAIAAQMDRPCDRIYFVGDTLADVEVAQRAGMRSIAVTWGFRDADQLAAAKPDFLADRPDQIATFIATS